MYGVHEGKQFSFILLICLKMMKLINMVYCHNVKVRQLRFRKFRVVLWRIYYEMQTCEQ